VKGCHGLGRDWNMTYICVKCQRTWILNEPTDYVSGVLVNLTNAMNFRTASIVSGVYPKSLFFA
jgi:hypothetical protein